MPDGLNRVEIIGNLDGEPEMRYTANGTAVTTFRLAVHSTFAVEGENRDSTEWFRCVVWDKLAETAQAYLTRNRKVYLEGRQSTRSWEDQEGQKKYTTEVIGYQLLVLDEAKDAPLLEPGEDETYDVEGSSSPGPNINRSGLNRVEIIGNLGRDPEMRYTANGSAVNNFSVAVGRTFMSDGERKEETEWFRCVSWNKQAELVQAYLRKGSKVYVEGRTQNRSWDGQDGQKRYTTELVVNRIIFLDRAPGAGQGGSGGYSGGDMDPDDVPFEP